MSKQAATQMTTTTATEDPYFDKGTGGEHDLTVAFMPSSVTLTLATGAIELNHRVWEYTFVDPEPQPLLVRMHGGAACSGTVDGSALANLGGVLHLTCAVPECNTEEEFELEFSNATGPTVGETTELPAPSRGRPRKSKPHPEHPPHPHGEATDGIISTSAKPTLIIRTKRSCPTGVSGPTIEE